MRKRGWIAAAVGFLFSVALGVLWFVRFRRR
jgi:hypothetical protein